MGAPKLLKICVCEKSYTKSWLCTQNQKIGGFTHLAIFCKPSPIYLNYLVLFAQHFESEKCVRGHSTYICPIAFLFQTRSSTTELGAVGFLHAGVEEESTKQSRYVLSKPLSRRAHRSANGGIERCEGFSCKRNLDAI